MSSANPGRMISITCVISLSIMIEMLILQIYVSQYKFRDIVMFFNPVCACNISPAIASQRIGQCGASSEISTAALACKRWNITLVWVAFPQHNEEQELPRNKKKIQNKTFQNTRKRPLWETLHLHVRHIGTLLHVECILIVAFKLCHLVF